VKFAFITTSVIPSSTANSIQAMKVVHTYCKLGYVSKLWVPDFGRADWQMLAEIYGVNAPFDIEWESFKPALKQYDFSWKSVRSAINWGADIIYTWSLQAAVFALWHKKAVIIELHDYPMGRIGPILFRVLMQSKGKKLVLCTTKALAEGIEKRYKLRFDPKELQIAPNGCEPEQYQNLPDPPEARFRLGLKEGFTVVYSGHFYSGRGMDLLTKIAEALPNINFLWAGGKQTDIEPWPQHLSDKHILNVTITGFIPNSQLPLYQAAADVLVMPYGRRIAGSSGGNIAEIINPMKMFDYLAAGRALVASDIPVFHEVLHRGVALFCQPDVPEEWISTITKLSQDANLRQQLAHSAKKEALKYAWSTRSLNTLTQLEELLQ